MAEGSSHTSFEAIRFSRYGRPLSRSKLDRRVESLELIFARFGFTEPIVDGLGDQNLVAWGGGRGNSCGSVRRA
jgi:hypothetical protein